MQPLLALLEIFEKGGKGCKRPKIVILQDHKIPDGPTQAFISDIANLGKIKVPSANENDVHLQSD